jgi:hypothetical protein
MDLDLDINNYSINDIERFLKLDPKKKYKVDDIELHEYEIREQLLSSGHIDKKFKRDLVEFLSKCKKMLTQAKFDTAQKSSELQTIAKGQSKEFEYHPQVPTLYQQVPTDITTSRSERDLVTRPETQFTYSNPSEFFQGSLNPLNTRVVSKCISVDTRFRDNYTKTKASDFIIQLPSKLNKVVSMQLSAIEFPINYFSISASYGNNFLYLYVNTQTYIDGPIEQYETVIVIPDGNYSGSDLIDVVNLQLGPRDSSGNLIFPTEVEDGVVINPTSIFSNVHLFFDVNLNLTGTGRTIVEPYGPMAYIINSIGLDFRKGIDKKEDGRDITTKFGWNLGFNQETYFGKRAYTSDTTMDMNIMRYMYFCVDDYQRSMNSLFFSAFHTKPINENCLARISLEADNFTVYVENKYNLITEPRRYFGPVDIQRLRIHLLDDHGRPFDIAGANYSFVLTFKLLYDL